MSPSVHLSGGTPGRALPPYDPCPPGRPTSRPARSRRRERRGSRPMHQQPTPPPTAEDQCLPWDRRACLPPKGADVTARQIIAAPPSPKDLWANSATDHDRPPAWDPGPGQVGSSASAPVPGRVRSPASSPVPGQVRSPASAPGRSRRNAVAPSVRTPQCSRTVPELPPTHAALICVALPGLAISDGGQLAGRGLDGFYRAGRRLLSRCQVRVAGREPLAVLARMTGADSALFVGTLRASPTAGPDPDVVVERTRRADGTERIMLRSAAMRPLRLSVEVAVGTDTEPSRSTTPHSPSADWPPPATRRKPAAC
ncbi:glycogen debranching N-terminal domain-containing protein [Streptomyces sp. NPDC052107]|uniref:glycogen debranching N-terminal domain-containing protein n=1 Tax=Streptomyces sp. NPDC052107 TaxID=3155632 RepID=UPI00342036D4